MTLAKQSILAAFQELGRRCRPGTEIILAGGAAAVLRDWIRRATNDIDVLEAYPALSAMRHVIDDVSEALGFDENWINDSAKAYLDVLPEDFRTRLVDIGTFGTLRVWMVSRMDFILLKLYAFRAIDFEDLQELRPRRRELEFVRAQLPRLAKRNAKQAHRIELYLAQERERDQ